MAQSARNQPAPGSDSTVEDWFGQSVEGDAELADAVADELGTGPDAEQAFAAQATGAAEQGARHGDSVDPDQGRPAYRDERSPDGA